MCPPIEAMTPEECLEIAVRHTLGTGYEHEWRLPPEMFIVADEYIHAALRQYYEARRGASGR